MTTYRYAAYGSNLHPERLVRRVPSAKLVDTARVPDFDLRFHKKGKDGSGKCDIVAADGEVYVAVYEILLEERFLLDKIEGLGSGYNEARISVPGIGECFTYRAAATHIEAALAPYTWYKELVILGCEFNEFPDEYIRTVRDVADTLDQHEKRLQANESLVELLRNAA